MITDSIISHCLHPIKVADKATNSYNYVPCGKCSFCRAHSISVLSHKLDIELLHTNYAYVFTLTYNNENVKSITLNPDNSFSLNNIIRYYDKKNILQTLTSANFSKSDFYKVAFAQKNSNTVFVNLYSDYQLFIKRLRKYIFKSFKTQIRYFLTLEYGSTSFRPHAHLIIFSKTPLCFEYQSDPFSSLNTRCITIEKLWKNGFATYDGAPLKSGSLSSYISNYVNSIASIPSFLSNKCLRPRSRHSSFLGLNPSISIQDIDQNTTSFVTKQPTITKDNKNIRFDLFTSAEYTYFFPRLTFASQHSFSSFIDLATLFIDSKNKFKFSNLSEYTNFILNNPQSSKLFRYLHINDNSNLKVTLDFSLLENIYTDFPVSKNLNLFNLFTHKDLPFLCNTYCCSSKVLESSLIALSRLQYIYYYFSSICRRHLSNSFSIHNYITLYFRVRDLLSKYLLNTSLYALQNSSSDIVSFYYSLLGSRVPIIKDLLTSFENLQNEKISKHIKHKKQSSIL